MTIFAGVAAPLIEALSDRGFDALTPVQSAVIEDGISKDDLLVSAQTGSGKTVAFGLAIANQILQGQDYLCKSGCAIGTGHCPYSRTGNAGQAGVAMALQASKRIHCFLCWRHGYKS